MRNRIQEILPFSSLMFIVFVFLMMPQEASSSSVNISNVWPKPTTFSWPRPQFTILSPNLTVSIFPKYHNNKYLTAAVSRYLKLFFTEKYRPLVAVPAHDLNLTSSPQIIQALRILVSDVTTELNHGVNESYTLTIPSPRNKKYSYGYESTTTTTTVLLTAETVWGAMRGLETFSQLIINYGRQPAAAATVVVASGVYVRDEPLYLHRGVMLDTGRNYYGVEDLLRLIRALSMNKLNVFHWHITDSQSFPMVLPSEPKLARKGAYGDDMMYSSQDVKKVVEFGMEHGVRVVPEIDMPGHTGSWAEAYPDIVTCEDTFWLPSGSNNVVLAAEPGTGQLNPLNPKTYQVVKNVIRDVVDMFPDSFYHAGADEINPNCWKSDPSIQDFISNNNNNNNGTLGQVLEIFVSNTLPFILSKNRTVVYWEDVLLDAVVNVSASVLLPKDNVILQTWNNGPKNTKRIVSSGYRAIVSSSDHYYLDCGHGDFVGNNSLYNQPPGSDVDNNGGSWCGPFKTWQTIYNYDITYGLREEEAKLVIGGEVALWSEQSDSTVMDSRIWPRASAMAETLWSGNKDETGMKRYAEATDRLNEWRDRMVKRGIRAEPIQPLWCLRNPGMCNTI